MKNCYSEIYQNYGKREGIHIHFGLTQKRKNAKARVICTLHSRIWFLKIQEIFGSHVTVRRSDRPSSTKGAREPATWYCASMLWSNAWQLSREGIRWPIPKDCIKGTGRLIVEAACFFKLSTDKLLVFNQSPAEFQVYCLKYIINLFKKSSPLALA